VYLLALSIREKVAFVKWAEKGGDNTLEISLGLQLGPEAREAASNYVHREG
jgi:hypothetical protein